MANPYTDFPTGGPSGSPNDTLIPIPDHVADRLGAPHGLYYKPSSVPGHAPQYNKGEGALYKADGSVYYNRTVMDKLIPWISAGILGTIGASGLGMALGGGAGAASGGILPSSPTVPASAGMGMTSAGGYGLAGAGAGSAALNANAATASAGNAAAKGAAGTAGSVAAKTIKDKLIDAMPLLAGAIFGSQGPLGGKTSDGMGGQSAELESLLQLMKQRLTAQGPLFSAVNQGAYNLLPNSAKQGNMFAMPSSTGGGY